MCKQCGRDVIVKCQSVWQTVHIPISFHLQNDTCQLQSCKASNRHINTITNQIFLLYIYIYLYISRLKLCGINTPWGTCSVGMMQVLQQPWGTFMYFQRLWYIGLLWLFYPRGSSSKTCDCLQWVYLIWAAFVPFSSRIYIISPTGPCRTACGGGTPSFSYKLQFPMD